MARWTAQGNAWAAKTISLPPGRRSGHHSGVTTRPLTCSGCGQVLAPDRLHFRFALEVEGEQQAVDEHPTESSKETLARLLRTLETADAAELEAQVHFEASGVLCPACRRQLLELVGHGPAGPH